jgi:hypothetical protein
VAGHLAGVLAHLLAPLLGEGARGVAHRVIVLGLAVPDEQQLEAAPGCHAR